ncbi:MAG: tetratricopeptide repeat protein, partial [Rubripirellula sp.]
LTAALALANVAEKAVDLPPANRYDRVMRARNLMTEATAILKNEKGDIHKEALEALERRLVERELQFGSLYAANIRRRIIALNAEKNDKELLRAFAIAKHTIARGSETPNEVLDQETEQKAGDFWLWLDQQPIPQILDTAWKANPQSIEIAARLAREILERPDSFPKDGSVESELASRLAELREDGRALLILHSLLQKSDATAATALLNENVDPALNRLKQQLASPDPTPATETSTEVASQGTTRTLPPLDPSQSYQPLWDFNLIIAWARENVQSGSIKHEKIDAVLDQLLALKAPTIPRGLIEDVYVLRVREATDENASILDSVLLAGIERLGVDSPKLQLQRAARLSISADLGNAKAAVQQLEETLQERRARLVGIAGTRLTAEQKSAEATQLETLNWSKNVLRGVLARREGLLEKACQLIKSALRSQVPVSNQQRVQATVLLADLYRRMAAWDLAATTYEAATLLSPERQDLRVLAANAWTSAGNVSNAFAQWKKVEGNSLPLQLQQLRALIAEEIAKSPSRQNFENIWRRLDTLNDQLTTTAEDDKSESIQSELALLALAVPDRDDGSERKSNLQRLLQLADASPNDARLQQFAAISLARAGKTASGRTLIQRLRQIDDIDSLAFTLANAKFEAAAGNLKVAVEALLTFIENNPNEAFEATTLAATYMASDNSIDEACELLQRIPPQLHTPESGFQLFSYALAKLPTPITSEADFSTLNEAERLLAGLKEPTQTWWKLAKAIRLLTESSNGDLSAEESAKLTSEAGQLSAEISAIRPRWGLGLSLAGQVAAARGENMAAIQSLQAGISNGDVRLSSSYLLTQLLLRMNRVAEAEAEYSRFERLRQANSNIAAFGVSIAERKGDYTQSLELARQTAESNGQDEIAWLLVAQAAMVAAGGTNDELAKADLLSEARTALDIALGLSNDTSIRAYQMLLRFRAKFFNEEALRAELLKLSESKVSEPARSLFSGRSYLQIKDPASALPLLKRAQQNAPTDPTVFVALSEYYQFIGDDPNTIETLERAFQLAPNRVDIRNRLAIAIALRSGSDIPWQRLKILLDTNLIGDSKNKLLHALILLNRGNKKQELQAEQLLQDLVRSNSPKADDARRLLASLLRKRWGIAASIDSKSPEAQRALAEARGVYRALINREKPKPLDIYRLGDLLLRAEQTQDVTALADQLDAITKGSPVALDLRLRLAKQAGDSKSVEKYAQDWANRAIEVDGLLQASVWETAGQLLSRLGYHEESIDWLERAYR